MYTEAVVAAYEDFPERSIAETFLLGEEVDFFGAVGCADISDIHLLVARECRIGQGRH
jgi:hypothetical protein